MCNQIRVTVWNEFIHERSESESLPKKYYPEGMHTVIAKYLETLPGVSVKCATQDMPEHGLTQEVLDATDVLIWWGHVGHADVCDKVVERLQERIVLGGMGLVVLHSGHYSKIFKKLMGTTCNLKWREIGEKERVWVLDPAHPITKGLGDYFEVPHSEMYGERFDIPQPDELVLASWYAGGEIFRSGCCFHRGRGKIFYFSPGHETYPIYYQPEVQLVIGNGVEWAAPLATTVHTYGNVEPLETVEPWSE